MVPTIVTTSFKEEIAPKQGCHQFLARCQHNWFWSRQPSCWYGTLRLVFVMIGFEVTFEFYAGDGLGLGLHYNNCEFSEVLKVMSTDRYLWTALKLLKQNSHVEFSEIHRISDTWEEATVLTSEKPHKIKKRPIQISRIMTYADKNN